MAGQASGRPGDGTQQRGSQPIRHVGVCVDCSPVGDRIVPHAVALARAFGAKLTVLHALEPPHEGPNAPLTDALAWEVQRADARRHLAAVESEHSQAELLVAFEVLEGRPAEELRDWVDSNGVDVTVMCSHGSSGWTEWSLASTARKLIEGISGSILLVPAWSVQEPLKRKVTYDRILVLLDGSPRAESALTPALSVARAHGSDLLLLHVVARPECSCPGPIDEEERDLEQRLVDHNTRVAETYLHSVRKHVADGSVPVRTLVTVDGDVRSEILRRIAADHIDLVVLSGHGRGGRAELPFGSVAGFLLENATAPLLVIREPNEHATRKRLRSDGPGGMRPPNLTVS
ncbi:MAG: universal stress protein [Deltaproteobacteria bacterium]|nr:universal stress protein [Deltaproteobacteria bacterium]MBW2387320.1 universal stress protein [Deltaproteobacteria bacterium]